MRARLYVGLKREGKWFRYAEIEKVRGGGLAVLDGPDKTGASRILNLVKASTLKLYNEADEEYLLKEPDYMKITVADSWKIAKEALKIMNNVEALIFPEFFYCPVCSSLGREKYTEVNEDWDELVEKGFIDEIFIEDDQDADYWVDLPVGITVPTMRNGMGGTYHRIKREHITLGDMIRIQKNNWAQESEANMICSVWDATIVEIDGMPQREFTMFVKRNSQDSFTKNYLTEQEDFDAMEKADQDNTVGLQADYRFVSCKHCHSDIGGSLDFTNFFQSLLSMKSSQKGIQKRSRR